MVWWSATSSRYTHNVFYVYPSVSNWIESYGHFTASVHYRPHVLMRNDDVSIVCKNCFYAFTVSTHTRTLMSHESWWWQWIGKNKRANAIKSTKSTKTRIDARSAADGEIPRTVHCDVTCVCSSQLTHQQTTPMTRWFLWWWRRTSFRLNEN